MATPSESRKNVVIIGAGAYGASVARELALKLDTTRFRLIVINPRPFFIHLPAILRTIVTTEGTLEKKVLMPYGDFLRGKGEVKIGKAVSFTEWKEGGGEVVLQDGEKIPYEVLVLTQGSVWEGPLALPDDPEELQAHFDSWREKFRKADSIALVGGGAVGIELAGELRDFFPSKAVTVVHGQRQLTNDAYPDKYRTKILASLRKSGTTVILDDYLDTFEPNQAGIVSTRNGAEVKADLVISTRGNRPNTSIIADSLGEGTLTASGRVKVLPTLQIPGHAHIFAGGDIIDWEEQKQAGKATGHSAVIVKNVLSVLGGGNATAEYKGTTEMICTTVGRTGGAGYVGILWGILLGDWLSATVKGKGLLVEMVRGAYGFGKLEA